MALFCRHKTKGNLIINLLKIRVGLIIEKKLGKSWNLALTHISRVLRGDLNENWVHNLWLSLVKMIGTMPGTGIFV